MGRQGVIRQGNRNPDRRIERRFSRVFLVAGFFLLMSFFPARSTAKEHPIPLEKNTDTAICLTCHDEKAKGKVLHTGAVLDCSNCHEVRVAKDVTRIKLKA